MYKPKALIDVIRSFSPAREKWISIPAKDLPGKVAVSFKTGQTGFLDMKNSRAVHWARMIDRMEQANQPVYVEIDEETNIITNVRIPRIYKVEKLDPDEHGNLMVRLKPSQAIHALLRSDPNFESMRASLQAALDDGSERLITETRDEHEIIDVRKPQDSPGGSPGPGSSPPPIDPPVSEARAGEVFNNMKSESCSPCDPNIDIPGQVEDCIPFLFPDDGCWIRAHIMCYLMRTGGPDTTTNPPEDPEKIWIDASPGNRLDPLTPNHPDCRLPWGGWGWHVAPTLMVSLPGGNEKRVIDPSLSPVPESKADWKNRQRDPGASLTEGPWTDYNQFGDNSGNPVSLAQAHQDMQYYRGELLDRCLEFGPPPYNCTRNCFFIIDRNTFSNSEIEAMLHVASPAIIDAAFYIVVDGFSPYELGFTSATMEKTPALNISPNVSGMTIAAHHLVFEYPTHLNRRQRLTWVYNVRFDNISGFTSEQIIVTLPASLSTVSSAGYIYLIKQPNPYETDGPTSWLSTDLRVFQIKTGDPKKFDVDIGNDPSAFITQVISNLNSGNASGQTFEDDISTDQQTSRLELSQMVGGIPVYNFAVAKVRYRALSVSATDVRVFFRLFPVATTSLEYDPVMIYRRHEQAGNVIPLLGIKNNEVAAIPCFAAPRIDSSAASMTTQTDIANVQTIPPNASGTEVIRYFGCWLDINQTQPQFPIQPSPVDGPYPSGWKTIQELIRSAHQCLVSEIAFTPAPVQSGATPSTSDKLAQRNLAIVESANPGIISSRRIPQTFEIRPSASKLEHDELMIDWGNIPAGSYATIYLPGIDMNDTLLTAAKNYRSHRLVRIDEHTLRCEARGITYLPIPFVDGNIPGMITVDLPEGVKEGQVFTIVVRQVAGEYLRAREPSLKESSVSTSPHFRMRHIVGSFQITIPVREKAAILEKEERLLSNLRWIERAIPASNRWSPVFGKYVMQTADRVDSLGGESRKIVASPSGEWRKENTKCSILGHTTTLLIAILVVDIGILAGGLRATLIPILALLIGVAYFWIKSCRPTMCQLLRKLMTGAGIGTIILALLLVFGISTPQLITTLIVSIGITAVTTIVSWVKRCF